MSDLVAVGRAMTDTAVALAAATAGAAVIMIAAADAETYARVLALVGPHLTAQPAECDHSTRRN